MPTLTIKINDKVYDKVLWFLNQFKKSDVEIVDEAFLKTQRELQKDYEDTMKTEAKSYTIEEFEQVLEETIEKYEDKAEK